MAVTKEMVEHIAKLAKLTFSEAEKETFSEELNQILNYIEKLNELETSDIEPLSHTIEMTNAFRSDSVQPSLPAETAVENAPSKKNTYFKVPKVIK